MTKNSSQGPYLVLHAEGPGGPSGQLTLYALRAQFPLEVSGCEALVVPDSLRPRGTGPIGPVYNPVLNSY